VSFESESFAEAYGPAAFIGFLVVVFFGSAGFLLWPSSSAGDGFLTAAEVRLLTSAARSEAGGAQPSLGRTSSLESEVGAEAGTVALFVDTAPSGALVAIDGDAVGVTPLDVRQLPSNWHVVAVEKEGFIAEDTLIYVDGRVPARVTLALTPSGREQAARGAEPEASHGPQPSEARAAPAAASASGAIGAAVSPADVSARVDGERMGTAPIEAKGVPPGPHTLPRSGGETAAVAGDVEAGAREPGEVAPVPQTGVLSVVVRPWGSVYIDGALHARDTDVRFDASLPVGRHHVRVVHPELGVQERTVEVRADRPASATFYLE
jgi:hypothetical protein